jgi:hypothetical protein
MLSRAGLVTADVIPLEFHMNEELASKLIEHATQCLEKQHASTGRVNLSAVRTVGDAAQLLGFFEFAKRCETFLRITPPKAFWQGVITNIQVDRNSISDNARKLTSRAILELEHPQFTTQYAESVLTMGMGVHIGLCRTRDYHLAFENAGTNIFQWHEVVLAQALNGEISLAMKKLPDIDNSRLLRHVQLVIAIECYRRGDVITGSMVYDLLQSDRFQDQDAAHLALGITNRVPWMCYPFADY